jgi:hypothetical protein
MRFLIKVSIPNEAANKAIRDGTFTKTMSSILEELKPEAVYFTAADGRRTGFIVADMKDAHQMVSIGEPWFLAFNASIEVHPVMTPEDLQRGGPDMERAAETYG